MSKKKLKVGLDAGHAGFNKTAGKRTPDGEYEWDFNNIVVLAMEKEFANYEGVSTLRVDDRTGKRDVPLAERTDLVNDWGADIFVSTHHNANTGKYGDWTGTETYIYNGKVSQETKDLAKIVHNALVDVYGLRDRGVKTASFHINRESNMPAVLTEGGYMDSRIDIKVMRDKAILEKAGINVAKKVAESYGMKRKAKPVTVATTPKSGLFYRVQVGAFKDISGVAKYAKQVESKTGFPTYITEVDGFMKVQVGAFTKKDGADKRLADVKKHGYKDAFVTTKSGAAVAIAEPQDSIPVQKPVVKPAPKPVVKPKPAPKPVAKSKKYNLPTGTYKVRTPLFRGNDVREIQDALASIHFYPERGAKNDGCDGYYGAKTANAVKRFQLMYGLVADGIYGTATRNKLNSIVNK